LPSVIGSISRMRQIAIPTLGFRARIIAGLFTAGVPAAADSVGTARAK
jgi:hypothetical protein